MKILITNHRLAKRTGTELYVFELALELLARGHTPIVFAPQLGPLAEQLQSRTVPVVARLSDIGEPPDVIHGHHFEPLLCACLRFPRSPAVFCCHSWNSLHDRPPCLARIQTYAAVDSACRDRLIYQHGIPAGKTTLIHNFVNLGRFAQRDPLPQRPRRALLFTNRRVSSEFRKPLAAACQQQGVELEFLGSGSGAACQQPENVLPGYDLVFARGKAAIEAMAVGCAVIVCDRKGMGPLVTPANFSRLRDLNFGRRAFVHPVTAAHAAAEIACYSPADCAEVAARVRRLSTLELAVDQWVELYERTVAEFQGNPAILEQDLIAASAHLESLGATIRRGQRYDHYARFFNSLPQRMLSPISRLWSRRRAA